MENIEHHHEQKKILIAGAGNIGITLGALLENNGHEVTLVGGKKLKSLGNFVNINGKRLSISAKKYVLPTNDYFDYIFVTSKLYNTKELIQEINKSNLKYGNIAIIQNGLVPESFYREIGLDHPLTISVYEGHSLWNNEVTISKNGGGWQLPNDKLSQEIAQILQASGIDGKTTEDIGKNRAIKMILNCSVNGLSALYKKSIKELLEENKNEVEQIMKECYEVLSKTFTIGTYQEVKENSLSTLEKMGGYFPSTYQDIVSGKQTEIEFLNGYIVNEGEKHSVPTPMNTRMYEEIQKIEQENKKEK